MTTPREKGGVKIAVAERSLANGRAKRALAAPVRFLPRMRDDFLLALETPLTKDEFSRFCALNHELRIERSAAGAIEIMPPTKGDTGAKNNRLSMQVGSWADRDQTGVAFDSSAGFELPNGALRSPDVAWVERARLAALRPADKREFLPLCPDFVIELRSSTDRLRKLQEKMEEFIANGARLGWLIDALARKVYVYRPHAAVEVLDNPKTLRGEPVLRGFKLDLKKIWEPDF